MRWLWSVLTVVACGDDAGVVDQTPPTVVSITPSDGTEGVERMATVVVRFSESIDPLTIDAVFVAASGQLELTAPNEVTWTASTPLPPLQQLTVVVSTSLQDRAHNALAEEVRSTFRIRARRLEAPLDLGAVDAPPLSGPRPRPVLGADRYGNALLLSVEAGDLRSRRYDAATRMWEASQLVETAAGTVDLPALVVFPEGQALVVFQQAGELFWSSYDAATKRWQSPVSFSTACATTMAT